MQCKVSEIKISYNSRVRADIWHKIGSSKEAAELIFNTWDKNTIGLHESFKVVLLNNANKVKGIYELSTGGLVGTLVDIRILFAVVLKSLSVGIILTHNHPSGTLKASTADKNITNKIKAAAKLFDVKVLDHIIITPNGDYCSLADEGLL